MASALRKVKKKFQKGEPVRLLIFLFVYCLKTLLRLLIAHTFVFARTRGFGLFH